MTKYVGNAATIVFNSSAQSANMITSIDVDLTNGTATSTGISDTAETYSATTKDGTITVNGYDDSLKATILDKFAVGTSSTFTVNPKGSGTGNTTITGSAIVTALKIGTITNNTLTPFSATLQITGGATVAAL